MFKLPPIAVILCLNISLVLLCCVEYPLAHGSIRFLDQMPQQIGEGQRMSCRKCIDLRLLLIGKMWRELHPLNDPQNSFSGKRLHLDTTPLLTDSVLHLAW